MFRLFVAEFPNSLAGQVNLGAALLAQIRGEAGTPAGLAEVLPILPEPGIVVRGSLDRAMLEQARASFKRALQLSYTDVVARAGLSMVLLRFGEYDEARSTLRTALELEPGNCHLLLSWGNVEFAAGDYATAVAKYLDALALRPGWPQAIKNLAMAHEMLQNREQACELWREIADDPLLTSEAVTKRSELCAADD
jgi:Flp pilus assembly protein TadD